MIAHELTFESDIELPAALTEASALSLMNHILQAERVEDSWLLGIQFVDDPTMQAAHAEFMNIDEPTDIMTFPYADEDDIWGSDQHGGDLIISVDMARSNAHDGGWEEEDELFFLIAHGLLHLLGWDDLTENDRARMLARQSELIESWSDRP